MVTLTSLIRQAQQCNLLETLELDPYERAYLSAKRNGDSQSMRVLALAVHAILPTGVHSQCGIDKLVRNEFGATIGDSAIRCDLRCNKHELFVYRQQVRIVLNEIQDRLKAVILKGNK